MFRSLWFHYLLQLKSRSVRRRHAALQRRTVRLYLEGLEDRVTPTTTPLPTSDAAPLAGAIAPTNGDDYTHDVFNITLTGATDNLDTQSTITSKAQVNLIGSNPAGTVINAAADSPAFELALGANVTFQNSKIQGGNVTGTTPVNPAATTAPAKSNAAGVTAAGGGVFVTGAGSLTIEIGSVIQDNQALGFDATSSPSFGVNGGFAQGGGVYVSGSNFVTISASIAIIAFAGSAVAEHITNNTVRGGTGGSRGDGATRTSLTRTNGSAGSTLAIDGIELVLSQHGFGAQFGLPSQIDIQDSINTDLPFAGGLGDAALTFGMDIANDTLNGPSQ